MYRTIRIVDRADPETVRRLDDALYAFNAAATGIDDARELFAELRDPDGELYAGVPGWSWGGTCWIELLWVRDDHRVSGIGTALMRAPKPRLAAASSDTGCKAPRPHAGAIVDLRVEAVVEAAMRDDRVLPETRVLGAVIVPFLVVAFALLYFFPDDTRHWFAWDVQPSLTPLVMGAGYIAGAYFFVRVALETRWHRVQVGFLPVTAFTLFMAIGTFLHLDDFLTAHVGFWIWVVLYVATPVLVPLAWWRNRATDPGTPEPDEPALPGFVRPLLIAAGAVQSAVALVLLLSPSTMIEHWPWELIPLTAQTLGGWFALPGVTALMMGLDGRWTGIRITLESQLIGLALILLGTIRAWADIDTSNALAYVFVAGIAGLFVSLFALEGYMLSRTRTHARSARVVPSP